MAMGLLGGGFDSSRAAQDEFDAWYDTEHIPERLRIPGFINAVRWVGTENPRISLAIYDLDSLDVLTKPEYRAVSPDRFSPWSKRILVGKCERLCRFNCVQTTPGDKVAPHEGTGLFVFAANPELANNESFAHWLASEHLARIAVVPGVLCARAFRTPDNAPGSQPALPTIRRRRSVDRWCTAIDHASPHLNADTLTGGTTGAVMAPGNRSGGLCRDVSSVTS